MGKRCHPLHDARGQCVAACPPSSPLCPVDDLSSLFLTDTPWDEPTRGSVEFNQYVTGEAFNHRPWNRFSPEALCTSDSCPVLIPGPADSLPLTLTLCAAHSSDHRHARPRALAPHDALRRLRAPLGNAVRPPPPSFSLSLSLAIVPSSQRPHRPSQLASRGPTAIAASLTEGLRTAGHMSIAEPSLSSSSSSSLDPDTVMQDSDEEDMPHAAQTQFTQSLMLFSQVQGGARYRYSPHLTRFFAALLPRALLALVQEALKDMGVKQNPPKELLPEPSASASGGDDGGGDNGEDGDGGEGEEVAMIRMRIGTKDRRKIHMKGFVEIEEMRLEGYTGSFVVFARDVVSRPGVLCVLSMVR